MLERGTVKCCGLRLASSIDDLHYVDLRDVLAFGSRRQQRSIVCRYISRTINAQFRDVLTYILLVSPTLVLHVYVYVVHVYVLHCSGLLRVLCLLPCVLPCFLASSPPCILASVTPFSLADLVCSTMATHMVPTLGRSGSVRGVY